MTQNTNEQVREYRHRHRLRSRWAKLLTVLACAVVFCTTYALILPAITLDQQTVCGLEEHTHTADCYASELTCVNTAEDHQHTDACYVSALVCTTQEHQHTESCYAQAESAGSDTAASEAASSEPVSSEAVNSEAAGSEAVASEPVSSEAANSEPAASEAAASEPASSEAASEASSEAAEEKAEPTAALTYEGEDYTVTVAYGEDANLPEGVVLKAEEYPKDSEVWQARYAEAAAIYGWSEEQDYSDLIRLFNIGLYSEDGEEVEPAAPVTVNIQYADTRSTGEYGVLHFGEEETTEVETTTTATEDSRAVEFSVDGFSDFMTLDLYDASTASISGSTTVQAGSSITLRCDSSYCYGSWSSSDTSIATVSSRGNSATVKGVKAGTVTITHSHGNWSSSTSTCEVTVTAKQESNEQAQIYALKSPTGTPGSNDTNEWTSYHGWDATVNMTGATWETSLDGEKDKNVMDNTPSYIISWPDGTTDGSWTISRTGSTSSYFNTLLEEIWDNYKNELQKDLGISNLEKTDVTSITLTPYKISQNNGTDPDKHVDCIISVKSSSVYTAKFWVKEVGKDGYDNVYAKNYKTSDSVQEYTYSSGGTSYAIGSTKNVGGVIYILTGWYTENEQGGARSNTKATFAYTPGEEELADGAVNFYAEWVPATQSVTVLKYDSSDSTKLLSGAVFTLTSTADASKVYSFSATNTDGEATLDSVPYGTYTLTESKAPDRYQTPTGTATVTVGDTISITKNGLSAKLESDIIKVPNTLSTVDVTIRKVDSTNSSTTLSGAKFELTGNSDQSFEKRTIEIGEGGTAKIENLPVGTYTLTEIKAPDGYNLLTEKITLTVSANMVNASYGSGGSTSMVSVEGTIVTIKNSAGTALPNTGGIGTAWFTVAGLTLVAAAAGLTALRRKAL